MSLWLVLLCLYIYVAGMFTEYTHNHTCKMLYSILLSAVWPVFIFIGLKSNKHGVPKYYKTRN